MLIGRKVESTWIFYFSQTVAVAMLGTSLTAHPSVEIFMWLQSTEDALRTMPRAFPYDARHQNRFHIRRTKKGDIKGDGNRERDGIAQGVPETWRRVSRGLQIPICVHIYCTREAWIYNFYASRDTSFHLSLSLIGDSVIWAVGRVI